MEKRKKTRNHWNYLISFVLSRYTSSKFDQLWHISFSYSKFVTCSVAMCHCVGISFVNIIKLSHTHLACTFRFGLLMTFCELKIVHSQINRPWHVNITTCSGTKGWKYERKHESDTQVKYIICTASFQTGINYIVKYACKLMIFMA